MFNGLGHDLRHAARALGKNPGFTFTAIATLTLAIGANLGVFTLANALIIASLPVPQPDRLVEISTIGKAEKDNLSIPDYQLIERETGIFANTLAWSGGGVENIEMNGNSFAGSVDEVAGDYYGTLGIQPALGRFITPEDIGLEHFTPSSVAVISYRNWQERYHGDRSVIGKTAVIQSKPYTIIGVHPKGFVGLIREVDADATVPRTATAASAERVYDRAAPYYVVIARLRDGVDIARAQARLDVVWPAIRKATAPDGEPEHTKFLARRIQMEPASQGISYLRQRFTKPIYILFGVVTLLLLLACVNLANISLARAHARTAEFAVRSALGAGRWRLLRASLVESMLLSLCGAIPGLAFAYWGSNLIARFMWQGYVTFALSVKPDTRVVVFATSVAILTGVLFGLIPAWRAGRSAIRQTGVRVAGGLGLTGRTLVAVQIAVSFAILAGALLFSRSLHNVLSRDPGFAADRLIVAQLFPKST